MTARTTKKRGRTIRYKTLDDMPPPKPLSKAFREMSDEEVERRAATDPDVIGWFKRSGKGYQSRMGAVLRSYVEAKRKRSA